MRKALRSAAAALLGAVVWGAAGSAAALDQPSPGAAAAMSITLPDGPASIRGLADAATTDVFTGQVGYQIPIEVPAGPGGFAPEIALRYGGELGNGPFGIGWSLDTIMIRRSERRGVPAYDTTDELDLIGIAGGGRLVLDPASNPPLYWVEGRGTSIKVVQRNGHFEVTDPNGVRYFLGMSSASREEQGAQAAAWMVDWVVDLAANEIDYSYTKVAGRLYLSDVAWGPLQSGARVLGIHIDYEARPDVVVSYRTGFPITTASRATFIRVKSFGHDLRTYRLNYDQSFALSRIYRVDLLGLDGLGTLPSASFTYGGVQQPQMISYAAADGWMLNQRGVMMFDVDGDGMSDLLRLELGNHEYMPGRGSSFAASRPLNGASDIDLESSAIVDIDGDARPELVRIVDDTWRVYSLSGQTWVSRGQWPGTQGVPLQAPDSVLVDINGDGRVDVVRPRGTGITVNFGGATGLKAGVAQPAISAADVAVQPGAAAVRFLDMNGDGLADVVWLTDAWMKIFLGRGDGTFVPFSRTPYPWGATAALSLSQVLLADLNRDGLVDLVRVDGGNVTWYRGESDLRFTTYFRHLARPESADADVVVTVADLNGNGSEDVVWSSPRGLWALDLAGATSAGMLTRIDNGLGMITTFTYDASATIAVAAERTGAPWEVRLPVSVAVPVVVEVDPGVGGLHRITQNVVRDGFWDGVERRFGGFLIGRKISVAAQPAGNLIEETRFLAGTGDQRVLRGKPWYAQTLTGNGTINSVRRSEWSAIAVAGLPASPLTSKAALLVSQVYRYEGLASPVEIRTTYEFDGEVRPTVEHYLGRVDVTGDEKVVRRAYGSDSGTWVRDRITSEQTEEASGTVVESQRTLYGAETGTPLALGLVGRGYVRETDAFLAQESRWILQRAMDYDACGNVKTNTGDGVTHTFTYDTRCLRLTQESVSSAAGKTLTWTAAWDDVRGMPSTVTDPNSDITALGYDNMNRISTMALNAAPAHIHFDYNWTAPRPSTTTWSFDGRVANLASSTWPTGAGWRGAVTYANGAGETLFVATALGTSNFVVSGWTERDERGRTVLTAEPFYATSTAIGVARPVGARVDTSVYDALNRLSTRTAPNGALTRKTYSAFGEMTGTAEMADVTTVLDGLDRVVHAERTVGLLESADATYDAASRLLTTTLQKSLAAQVVYTYAYDTLGRLKTAVDPDTGTRTLFYEDHNLLTQETNGAGENVYFEYDWLARLTRRGLTPAAVPATDYRYVYDDSASALSTGCHVSGRLAAVFEPSGQVKFCYDAFGRQAAMGRTVVPASGPSVTGRDDEQRSPSGLLLVATADDGFAVSYDYDAAARVSAIRNSSAATGGTVLWSAQTNGIDAAGRITSEKYGNNDTEKYTYDTLGLANDVRIANGAGTDLYHVTATRNSYGAVKTVTDAVHPPGSTITSGLDHAATYTYDLGGRLTDATMGSGANQFQFTYRYDTLQNMTFRQACGPTALGEVLGVLKYGGAGHGPRQLVSIATGSVP